MSEAMPLPGPVVPEHDQLASVHMLSADAAFANTVNRFNDNVTPETALTDEEQLREVTGDDLRVAFEGVQLAMYHALVVHGAGNKELSNNLITGMATLEIDKQAVAHHYEQQGLQQRQEEDVRREKDAVVYRLFNDKEENKDEKPSTASSTESSKDKPSKKRSLAA